MKRSISRIAMALALAVGTASVGVAPAQAQLKLSKGFLPSAPDLQTAVNGAQEDANIQALAAQAKAARTEQVSASDEAAKAAATAKLQSIRGQIDQAMGGVLGKLETAVGNISKEDDYLFAGQIALNVGQLMSDPALQKRGVDMMLQSGKLPVEQLPTYQYYSGALAYDAGDFAGAQVALQAAVDAGYTGNDIGKVLSESYFADGKYAEGLTKLKAAIERRQAAGQEVPEDWSFRGMAVAVNNQVEGEGANWALMVLRDATSEDYRGEAFKVIGAIVPMTPDQELDLMRLMHRANGFSDRQQYLAYIQAADARRRPAEAKEAVAAAIESGLLTASDTAVVEANGVIKARYDSVLSEVAADSKPALAAANGTEALAIADIYLGYRKSDVAEGLYRAALTKTGVDKDRVLTGLAIALADQGKYAEAADTFGQITTANRSLLAKAWMTYINSKM